MHSSGPASPRRGLFSEHRGQISHQAIIHGCSTCSLKRQQPSRKQSAGTSKTKYNARQGVESVRRTIGQHGGCALSVLL
jgi:hypothetical protein